MSDHWDFYPLLVDDAPASIMVDMGIASTAPIESFDTWVYLRLWMLHPREDGLSSQEEFEALSALGEAVTAHIERESPTLYVGRNTSSGNRDFHFYTRDQRKYDLAAKSAMAKFPDYQFELGSRSDQEWKVYFEFLYPTPQQQQNMGDRAVIENLAKRGDRGNIARQIDHWAFFNNQEACNAFSRLVESQGFAMENEPSPGEGAEFRLRFSRVDRPAEIYAVTSQLFDAASKLQGEYDGWECQVIAD